VRILTVCLARSLLTPVPTRPLQIPDIDALLTAIKSCLRTPNQHLTTATVSAIPSLLPLLITRQGLGASSSTSPHASTSSVSGSIIDVPTLRQVLIAFLPSGGILDRLGDSRDRAREKARESLALLGGYSFRCSSASSSMKARDGKGPETPLMIFEKFFKELGLGSKVWRVKEQALVTLAQIRRTHHLFPLRPYLPLLVDALEDSDSNVRGQAQTAVIELFTGPGVTDAARADLKKEMAKKGVRKTIVENVTARLLAAGGTSTPATTSEAGSENGDAGGAYMPPSFSLLNKTPGLATAGRNMPRSVSNSNVSGLTRPASRTAAISPSPGDLAASGGSDVKPVYVSARFGSESAELTALRRLHQVVTWRTSFCRC
jgi:CLIP-associating protein 1/2